MRIVVTGASGFIGGSLVRRLRRSGVAVVGASRQSIADLVCVSSYAEVPEGDILVHLGEASDRAWVNKEGDGYKTPALATIRSLLSRGFRHVVYGSSAVLYGSRGRQKFLETDPIEIVDRYTELKAAAEALVLSKGGAVARIVNVLGSEMAQTTVGAEILRQLRADGAVSVRDASPIRDFVWVEDVASALVAMSVMPQSGIFNVGSGVGTSIGQLAQCILEAAGQGGRSVLSASRGEGGSRLVVDPGLAERTFGWRREVTLAEAARELVKQNEKHDV